MIDTMQADLLQLLHKGINQARTEGHSQLISKTEKIAPISPLLFFNNAGKHQMTRAFWMTPDRAFTMVGAGEAYVMSETMSYEDNLSGQWSALQKKSIIHNPFHIQGTGLTAMGGMAFDPLKTSTSLWTEFPAKKLIVPACVLVRHGDEYYLTLNVCVTKSDDAAALQEILETKQQNLQGGKQKPVKQSPKIKDRVEIEPYSWKHTVRQAIKTIQNGPTEKVVLAREVRLYFTDEVDHGAVLGDLIETQSNSYVFAFHYGGDCFVGATPEQLVKIDEGHVFSMCLAGTASRGVSDEDDARLSNDLLHDGKNRQEHDFVVQMIKESLQGHCYDILIPEVPRVRQLKNLQHLYTPVTARLKQGHDVFSLVDDLHPTPALGGAPRGKALAFIREEERLDRGWYGAPIGWIDAQQNGEFAVAIRSGLIQGDEASLFAGCGIVADSDPDAEYEETNIKFKPMLNVLGGLRT